MVPTALDLQWLLHTFPPQRLLQILHLYQYLQHRDHLEPWLLALRNLSLDQTLPSLLLLGAPLHQTSLILLPTL
jgi:hypothetical protein